MAEGASGDELTLPQLAGREKLHIEDYNLLFSHYYLSVICSQQDSVQAPSHCAYNFCSQTTPELAGREKLMTITYYHTASFFIMHASFVHKEQ